MKHLLLHGILCTLLLAARAPAAQLDLTEAENGKDVLLVRGDLLVIRLLSNRTTGYGWVVASSKTDVLRGSGEPTWKLPKSARGLVGAGGVETWTFRAAAAGRTTLTFSYARPWEKGTPPLRVVAWPVTVRPR